MRATYAHIPQEEQKEREEAGESAPARATRPHGCGERHVYATAMFTGAMVLYAQRAGMAVSIVRMQSVFGWSKETQGLLLSAFFLGYTALQIPTGLLATRSGGARLVGISVLATSTLSIIVPTAIRHSFSALFLLRFLQGLAQAPFFSAQMALFSRWAPPSERSRLGAQAQIGGHLGTLIFGGLSGWQCDHEDIVLIGGWEGVFYLQGFIGLIWATAWYLIAAEEPSETSRCSAAEREYIQQALALEKASVRLNCPEREDKNQTELRGLALACTILKSAPLLAMCAAHTAADWTTYTLQDGLPGYLRDVLGYSLTTSGILASMPTLLQVLSSSAAAQLADWLREPGRCSTGVVRKSMTAAAMLPASILLGVLGSGVVTDETAIVITIASITGFFGFNAGGGYQLNPMDISPNLAGFTHAIMNVFGQMTGWVAPLVLGWLTSYPVLGDTESGQSREQWIVTTGNDPPAQWIDTMQLQWCKVFLMTACLNAMGLLAFLRWSEGERQWWDVVGKI